MKDRTIKVEFKQLNSLTTDALYQYDTGQQIEFKDEFKSGTEVQFEHNGTTINTNIFDGKCYIPDEVLTRSGNVIAWIQIFEEDNSTTVKKMIIPVIARTSASCIVAREHQPTFKEEIQKMVDAADDAADRSEAAMTAAGGFAAEAQGFKNEAESALNELKEGIASGDFKGEKGDKGERGERGDIGQVGPQGPKGDKGDTGERGPAGESITGPQGPQGNAGPKGNKGDKGDKGDPGEVTYIENPYDDRELRGRVKTLEDEPKAPDLTEEVSTLANRVKSLEDEPKAPERTAQQIIEEHITATPDYGIYTVRFPKWELSHTSEGEKLDDNQGLILTPATDTVKEVSTYPHAFDTIDVNAYVDDDGVRHITAIKGDKNFKDTGRVNVFVCFRTYWEKVWEEDGYEYYSRCFYPKEGYTINRLAINRDGTYNNWFLIAKYMAGNAIGEDGKPTHDLYSAKGLKCSHYMSSPTGSDELISDGISWQGMQSIFKKHGAFYTGSLMAELKHFHTTSMLYFATKHSQSVMYGLANSSVQYICAEPTENVSYFVVTDSQANNIDMMQCVSIGDNGLTTAPDRNIGLCHNIAYDCRVTKKEVLASGNVAIYIDHEAFTTTETSWISTFNEISGYSDFILGRTGSPVSNTNGRHGMVMDGVELMMGAYETMANVIFNATSNPLERQVMYTNDATKLSSTVGTFMQRADVSDELATVEKNGAWNYISEVYTDLDNGLIINTKSGLDGSNSTTGYADGQYFDAITTGQRELLSFGLLWDGAFAGLRFCNGNSGVSNAYWNIAARLSINAVGGELRSEA